MSSKGKIKGNLRRSDKWRTLITDTSPFEVPIIFSNDGFYQNMIYFENFSKYVKSFFECITTNGNAKYTIPYRYKITKSERSFRQLSLIHPSAQRSICDFYSSFDQLICYYCQAGNFSIRYPEKVSSSFYFHSPLENKNKFKNNSVDTTDIEKLVRNPASYFSYGGYDRLYKFFESNQFLQLEKKYKKLTSLDISKCFDSIYTHSISWSLKDIYISKQFTHSHTFGNEFDKLMQNSNFSETNGICIGPETSRIFSEIILSRVDSNIENSLSQKNIRHKSDYEIFRYVDNYYIFTNKDDITSKIEHEIRAKANEYKLHLNEEKSLYYSRPFYTSKSRITDTANIALDLFFDRFLETSKKENNYLTIPKKIRKIRKLSNTLINNIKSICYESGSTYHDVANYIVSALSNRIIQITDSYQFLDDEERPDIPVYTSCIYMLIELSFYFFTVSPKVSSSMRCSNSLLTAGAFIKEHHPDKYQHLIESALHWTIQLSRSPEIKKLTSNDDIVPIEIMNVAVSLADLSTDHGVTESIIDRIFPKPESSYNYFEIICGLYIAKDNKNLSSVKKDLVRSAYKLILDGKNLLEKSEPIHLLMDILGCPYISQSKRVDLLVQCWPQLENQCKGLIKIDNMRAKAIVKQCESLNWFVNWRGINLLSMIQKKQLSAVY